MDKAMKLSNREFQQKQFQALVRQVRLDASLRQIELARRLGLPQSFVSKYESGDRRLDILELRLVCQAVGISLDEFVKKLEDKLNETE